MEEHRNQSDTDALLEELLRETEEHAPAEPDQPPVPEEPGECPAEPVSDPEPEPESDMEKTQSFQSVKHVQEEHAGAKQEKHAPEHPRKRPAANSAKGKQPKQSHPSAKHGREHAQGKKRRRTNLPFVLVWTTIVVAISVVLSVGLLAIGKDMYAVDKDTTEKIINVPENATTDQIAQMLYEEDIIRIPRMYRLVSKLNGSDGKYVAGEHVVSASMSYETLTSTLTKPVKAETVRVTFPEGITMLDAAKLLEENKV